MPSASDSRGLAPSRPRFIDALPTQSARDCLAAWRAARHGEMLPDLWDFAPHRLPPALLPWVLIHRLRRDGELVYGLAGDELIRWFGENPKGKPVLGTSDAPVRAQRTALVRQSLATGMPFWYRGTLLLDNRQHVAIGRLCLPARDHDEHVLLLIYFVLGDSPAQPLRIVTSTDVEPAEMIWCEPDDLAD
jgi:PAS domain-containing protein